MKSKLKLKHLLSATGLALSLGISSVYAAQADKLKIENSFVREMPPMSPATGAFMLIKNDSDAQIRIISANSTAAGKVELHTHIMDNGVMRMRQTEAINIPANGQVQLEPGGLHIMLIKPQPGLVEGKSVEIQLNLEDGSSKKITVPVRKMQGIGVIKHQHGHQHGSGHH